jgi:hypothetical protein
MEYHSITEENIKAAVIKTANWKAAGPDKIQNFWWKRLSCVHTYLAKYFTEIIYSPEKLPTFFTKALMYPISKDVNNINNPAKYRPIACLPTIYKLLTACITDEIYRHLDRNNLIVEEQKGRIRKAYGCK